MPTISLCVILLKYISSSVYLYLLKEVLSWVNNVSVTGRKASTGNHRSHALNANKRRWNANLQKVRILVDGKPKKVWVSARALKSGKVTRV